MTIQYSELSHTDMSCISFNLLNLKSNIKIRQKKTVRVADVDDTSKLK